MIAIQSRFKIEENRESEHALVQAVGGRMYSDTAGNRFSVFNSLEGLPISRSAIKIPIQKIPEGWMEI